MEDEKRIDALQEKLERMYKERSRVEDSIFRQEEKFDIRELPETDVRYRNMVYLRERYNTLEIEIQKTIEELEKLKERPEAQILEEGQEMSQLQRKESELSSLEAEERTITEAEALIDQQKEGQDIGE